MALNYLYLRMIAAYRKSQPFFDWQTYRIQVNIWPYIGLATIDPSGVPTSWNLKSINAN